MSQVVYLNYGIINWGWNLNYWRLAWEPSAAKVTKSYSRRLPALNDLPTQLRIPTSPWVSRVPQPKFKQIGPRVSKLWLDKQTYRQINRENNFIYIYVTPRCTLGP